MLIQVNGKQEIVEEMPILHLLEKRGVDSTKVVVELNGEILPPEMFPKRKTASGDVVEIVQFVGGG